MIKRLLFRLLGMEGYLRFVSRMFFRSYRTGRLRAKPEYYCHYYVQNLIKKGDFVLDIGANLGYYSAHFAEWVGENGTVFSVEPVPIFRKILSENTARFSNVRIIPFALGTENGKQIEMGVPTGHKHFRHGMTQIIDQKHADKYRHTFQAEMRRGSDLFAEIERLDYIKCDIEGYEIYVLPELMPVIKKHRPIIQIETGIATRKQIREVLEQADYEAFIVEVDQLVLLDKAKKSTWGDLIFIPK